MSKNPLFQHRRNIRLYLLVWNSIIVAHAGILYCFYQVPLLWSLADSVVFNCSFAGMALSLWYSVRYFNIEQPSITTVIVHHVTAAVVFILIWLNLGYYALEIISQNSAVYQSFHATSMPWRFFFGLFYYCITILVYYLYLYYESFKQKQLHETRLQGLVKETELNLLKSQLNPHFIFNSLNSISSLTLSNPAKAQEMVIKLSTYIRYSLKREQKELVALEEELEYSKVYLEIEKVRFGDRLVFENHSDDDCLGAKVPNMILQPLLENAIKHGVYESIAPVSIELTCAMDGNLLCVQISNTCENREGGSKGSGIGLSNVKQRLHLIYGMRELVKIDEFEDRYVVKLYIPQYE